MFLQHKERTIRPGAEILTGGPRPFVFPFLIGTGSDLCVFPRSAVRIPCAPTKYGLTAANGIAINTYGPIKLNLHLSLRRAFTWNFIIADISKPIIGIDFLSFYNLIINCRNHRHINGTTSLSVPASYQRVPDDVASVKTVV